MTVLAVQGLELVRGLADQAFRVSLPELTLEGGEVIAITGPSGCGKSTLIEALGLLLTPSTIAHFELQGQTVTPWVRGNADPALAALRGQHFGFVPQSGGLLPYLTVHQNIALQARVQQRPLDTAWLQTLENRLGLQGLGSRRAGTLSVGQRQRVSFLRALAHRPSLLLADEPTAALDPDHAQTLFEMMLDVVRDAQITTLVVTHEWSLVDSLGLKPLRAQRVEPSHMAFEW
ncbi:MAG: ABC transporter ATP-binding protein [Orrella sp.]